MTTYITQAQIELVMPDMIEPMTMEAEMYSKHPRIKMYVQIEMKEAVIVEPCGRKITVPRLLIREIAGIMIPVVEDGKVVAFRIEAEADEPFPIKV